jgi:hypothetical protein
MKLFWQMVDVQRHSTSGSLQVKTDKDDKILIWLSNHNPLKNAVELNTEILKNYKVSTSVRTTKEQLRYAGLFG